MSQGVYEKFKSKKAFREAVANKKDATIQATSLFGDEYDGSIYDAPDSNFVIVGPDVYNNRKWYASVTKKGDSITIK